MTRTASNRRAALFSASVRSAYLAIAAREPQRVVLVDARGTAAETHARIVEIVRRKVEVGGEDGMNSPRRLSAIRVTL